MRSGGLQPASLTTAIAGFPPDACFVRVAAIWTSFRSPIVPLLVDVLEFACCL